MEINGSTRLIDMTLEDLLMMLDRRDREREKEASARQGLPSVVYGIAGLCDVYKCSRATAAKILRSGRIDAAVQRVSERKLIINVDKALTLCPNL